MAYTGKSSNRDTAKAAKAASAGNGDTEGRHVELIRLSEAARILNCHPRTLQRWRRIGLGPLPILIGSRFMYDAADVQEWLDAQVEAARRDQAAYRLAAIQ